MNENTFPNHQENSNGPGLEWISPETRLGVVHKVNLNELARTRPLHVRLMAGYVNSFIMSLPSEVSSPHKWLDLYNKYQNKRRGHSKPDQFNKLILNMINNGFEKSYPIPVDSKYCILDGAHRFAACLAIGIDPYVQIYNAKSHDIEESWFINNDFSPDEVKIIRENNIGWRPLTRVALIWSSGLPFWDEILDLIPRSNVARSFIRETDNIFEEIVRTSYILDGMPVKRLDQKVIDLKERGTNIGVIVCFMTDDQVGIFKKVIRERVKSRIADYFFDSVIHVVDDPRSADKIITMLN